MTKQDFIERYVAHMIKICGGTHFDDGGSVADYARALAETYPENFEGFTPEKSAEGDREFGSEE